MSPTAAADTDQEPAILDVPPDLLPVRDGRWRRLAQRGDGLGERLAAVFADLFADGSDEVVIAGSDSPALPPEYLEQAFAELEGRGTGHDPADLVLGPAADGGYYLVGAGRRTWETGAAALAGLLADSPMSSPGLLGHTLRAAQAIGLRSRSSRSGWTSTSRRTSGSSTGSRAALRRAASRWEGCVRSTCT